ncbi:83dd3967-f09c-4e34-9f2f-361f8138342f [Thermothielavioides terrestris]|uniref:83dd3967-f09c-4e34-9f2f-361f8138342f n=1 Tax=Thermothielavioides terrestris TaxID=2587410 RepID=A0A3S4F2M7_9PEZI|nr:83dd3967-f09c-4e34-9f2f-361f8138342f [Thermothielavioides terrestris]
MRLAIRVGLIDGFLLNFPTIPSTAIFSAPHLGESWDDLLFDGGAQRSLYWGVVQATLNMTLDLYLFGLSLPVISALNLSPRRRVQILVVFMTAFMKADWRLASTVF